MENIEVRFDAVRRIHLTLSDDHKTDRFVMTREEAIELLAKLANVVHIAKTGA